MATRNSVLMGTLGRYSDRFHTYQPARDYAERIEVAKDVPGADGIEPGYPHDLGHASENVAMTKASGMAVSAVNVNIKGEDVFRAGALTNPDPGVRRRAVDHLERGMDLAAELGTDMVSVCPPIGGSDHAFHVDHLDRWRRTIACFEEACAHRPEIRLSIEHEAHEVRNRIVLPSMGRTLHLCDRVGAPNLGVTMNLGHALIEGERAAAELVAAHEAGRLSCVHFDDDRNADRDMPVASVNLRDTLEAPWCMDRIGYDGWIACDVSTRAGDGAEAAGHTFETMDHLRALLSKIGPDRLAAMVASGDSARTACDPVKALP